MPRMGQLDETQFAALTRAGCPKCGSATLEIKSFIDRRVLLMLADPNDAGRWVHDGEKFVDGTYAITCPACAHAVFASDICPRCNAPGGLAKALGDTSRMPIPKKCPSCVLSDCPCGFACRAM